MEQEKKNVVHSSGKHPISDIWYITIELDVIFPWVLPKRDCIFMSHIWLS